MSTFPPFPAEHLLIHNLPNYEQEWNGIIRSFTITVFLFLFVIPSDAKNFYNARKERLAKISELAKAEDTYLSEIQNAISLVCADGSTKRIRIKTTTVERGQTTSSYST